MEIINNTTILAGILTALSFLVNIIVQLTKEIVPLPTKLWCIIVAMAVDISALCVGDALGKTRYGPEVFLLAIIASFVVAYVSMYGFDTIKDLWQRFKKGENINENT